VIIGPATFARLLRARARLEAGDTATVDQIARAVGLSPTHMIRQFSALFGATPHQLRTRARLERAKALLEAGTPVTTVCAEVGFASLGSFSALFTRWNGASPTRYRPAEPLSCGCLGMLAHLPANAILEKRTA
jgi:AraC-like DNA-binding protein